MKRGISKETPNRLLINEGVLYINYGESDERILGATRGGTEFVIEQEVKVVEIDGAKGPVKGTRRVVESIARITTELLEFTRENLMMVITGADATEDVETSTIRRTRELGQNDYFKNISVVGELADGRQIIIVLHNALNDEGVTVTQEDREEAVLPVQFTAHYDPADTETEPWEIRFPLEAV